jgi:hypothetical protein
MHAGHFGPKLQKKEQNIHVIYSDLSVQAAGHRRFCKSATDPAEGAFRLMQSRPSHCGNGTALPAVSFFAFSLYFLKKICHNETSIFRFKSRALYWEIRARIQQKRGFLL